MKIIRCILFLILAASFLVNLSGPALAQSNTINPEDRPADGQFAYVENDLIYLAELANGAVTQVSVLADSSGSSNPVWSATGRYLLYQQQYPGETPELVILDMQTATVVNTISNACCGDWNPQQDNIIYITDPGGDVITAGMDNSSPVVLWSEIESVTGQPIGSLAWATNGQILIGTTNGDYFSRIWVLDGDIYPLSGPDYGGVSSSDCLMAPATPNSLLDQISVTVDTSCLMFAPGGPVTMVRDAIGLWREVGMGQQADWIGGGPWLIWEQMTGCTDGPGFCRGGIGLINSESGETIALIASSAAGQPAWRPGNWPSPTNPSIPTPQPEPATPTAALPATPRPTSTTTLPTPITSLPTPPVVAATVTPQPGAVTPGVDGANLGQALANDGHEPAPGLLERILNLIAPPVEASSAADCQERFFEGQCTWFVAGKRPDACQWIKPGMGNAYQWLGQAVANGGGMGVSVRSRPQRGDIVVWQAGCGGTTAVPADGPCTIGTSGYYEGCGHVAYVTWVSEDGQTIMIEEANWSVDRSNQPMTVLSCMSFISSPETLPGIPLEGPLSAPPTPVFTPNPLIVPTPAPQKNGGPDFLQWLIDLFRR